MAKYANLIEGGAIERSYLEKVLITAAEGLPDDYIVIAKHCWQKLPPVGERSIRQKKIVLIENSNETHTAPRELLREDVCIIFSSYFVLDQWGEPIYSHKLLPLPLPHAMDDAKIIPMHERRYDFSFVGQIPATGTRHNFKEQLNQALKSLPYTSFVSYTDSFLGGLPREEYLEVLSQTKIALCPAGAYSLETFRFFEASRAGCLVMCEQLPKMWFYEQSPWMCARWSSVGDAIDYAMQQGEKFLEEVQNNTLEFYNNCAHPVSVGKYISHNTLNQSDGELHPFLVKSASYQESINQETV